MAAFSPQMASFSPQIQNDSVNLSRSSFGGVGMAMGRLSGTKKTTSITKKPKSNTKKAKFKIRQSKRAEKEEASRGMPNPHVQVEAFETYDELECESINLSAVPLLDSASAGDHADLSGSSPDSVFAITPVSLSDGISPSADTFLKDLAVGAAEDLANMRESRVVKADEDDEWSDEQSDEEEVDAADTPLDFKWLMAQQSANGMFKFSYKDSRFTSYLDQKKTAKVAQHLNNKKDLGAVLATLFALVALMKNFADRKTEWQFMFHKSKRWVSKQLQNEKDFEALLALFT